MAVESFLINPARKGKKRATRKKARAKRGIGREGSKHRPVVYSRGGHWTTSSGARLARPDMRLNPLGGEVVILGANPRRRKRRRGRKRNAIASNPRRRRRRSRSRSRKRRNPIALNPRRRRKSYRRRRRNPALTMRGLGLPISLKGMLPLAVTGGAAAVVATIAPSLARVQSPWAQLGVKAAVAVGGGIILGKTVGREHGKIWMVVSGSLIVADLLKKYVLGRIMPGMGDYGDEEYVGAFPYEDTVGAYPEEVDMAGIGGVDTGDYPYGGSVAY